ncbi:hypothetical protein KSF78_0001522 [Schistosoma japonicum]|nr:hypothetical protein KSF78_0001522 [Schistosoma japonicum]
MNIKEDEIHVLDNTVYYNFKSISILIRLRYTEIRYCEQSNKIIVRCKEVNSSIQNLLYFCRSTTS